MLRPRIQITITQDTIPAITKQQRNAVFTFNFVNECEIYSSWKNLTDTCKLKFPKKIYIQDEQGNRFDLSTGGQIGFNGLPQYNIYAGIPTNPQPNTPFIMRGDKIKVEAIYWTNTGTQQQLPAYNTIFEGYVCKINPKMPLEIECEDDMYKLKQIQLPDKVYLASQYTLETMVKELIQGTGFILKEQTENTFSTNIGDFRTHHETIAQVLERLRKDYGIESWFRIINGVHVLHCSGIVYYPDESKKVIPEFIFQSNISNTDKLVFTRTDDVRIGGKCYSFLKEKQTGTNNQGAIKTQNKRLEAQVGDPDGEIRTWFFWNVTTLEELTQKGNERLLREHFEGFRGSFETFGDYNQETGGAMVDHGNIVSIKNLYLPEMDGKYFVKGVTRKFGLSGYKQEIEIDLRVDSDLLKEYNQGGL